MEETNQEPAPAPAPAGGGGGGWGFSFSVFSDLQKAAEEISRNAVAVAKNAAKGIADLQIESDPDLPVSGEEEEGDTTKTKASESCSDEDPLKKSALEKLERASEESLLGQGLKVLDNSMESFATGAWQAFGTAWMGGSTLVHKLENSAANLADSIQYSNLPEKASSLAPSIIERGKSFTAKGVEVLERVGKETMDMLIAETGLEVDKGTEVDQQIEFEEVTFDRCFYIYGGPEQLEELEAISSHYALLFNRRKAKLLSEQKSFYDGKLKQIQQIFNLDIDAEDIGADSDKGKNIESVDDSIGSEMNTLRDSSVSKAADMASGFSAALEGIAANEIIQRTTDRLETIHSEGVHRVSELCCFAVSQLLTLGKSVISNTNRPKTEETQEDDVKIDWPEDSVSKAKIIRSKAQSMSGDVETVSNSFVTAVHTIQSIPIYNAKVKHNHCSQCTHLSGISEIVEAYMAAALESSTSSEGQKSIQERADSICSHLRSDGNTALGKIKDALHYLAYVLVSTSMPLAA